MLTARQRPRPEVRTKYGTDFRGWPGGGDEAASMGDEWRRDSGTWGGALLLLRLTGPRNVCAPSDLNHSNSHAYVPQASRDHVVRDVVSGRQDRAGLDRRHE